MIRHFGYACINSTLSSLPKDKKVTTNRTLRMSNFSLERCYQLVLDNCRDLRKILSWNKNNNILYFRISSSLLPFKDHPILGYSLENSPKGREALFHLKKAGEFAKENSMKLELHPGPFNCLASKKPNVIKNTISHLEMNSYIADCLGYDTEMKINIHVGSLNDNDFDSTAKRFIQNYHLLSDNCKKRLTLENDDNPRMWTVDKLYEYICSKVNIPIVLDYHHWMLSNEGGSIYDSANIAFSTWDCRDTITTHYSESRDDKNLAAHSDYIENYIEDLSSTITYDVMLECKKKELALLKYARTNSLQS